jgi:dipeptidyl aminopeptidase/acylaminoacyl peptidase
MAGAGVCSCARAAPGPVTQAPSGLQIRSADYALARQSFRTRLLYTGPSPQPFEAERPPTGVAEIMYPSGDLRLKAWIARPAQALERAPLVVFLHGGFAFGAEDLDMARPYLAAGYAVAVPMVRGENGLGGNYSMFYDEVDDAIAVTAHMKSQPGIDPEHVYLAGHSVGGTLAMLAGLASTHYRAVASFSGSPDQITFCRAWEEIVPFDTANPAEFEMRSPLSYAASFKAPARLFYAAGEVYGADTQTMARIAREARRDVEAIAVRGDHFSAVPEAMRQSIAFFREHA